MFPPIAAASAPRSGSVAAWPTSAMTVEIAPGPEIVGIASGTIAGSPSASSGASSFPLFNVLIEIIVKRIPPAI